MQGRAYRNRWQGIGAVCAALVAVLLIAGTAVAIPAGPRPILTASSLGQALGDDWQEEYITAPTHLEAGSTQRVQSDAAPTTSTLVALVRQLLQATLTLTAR